MPGAKADPDLAFPDPMEVLGLDTPAILGLDIREFREARFREILAEPADLDPGKPGYRILALELENNSLAFYRGFDFWNTESN